MQIYEIEICISKYYGNIFIHILNNKSVENFWKYWSALQELSAGVSKK